MSLPQIAWDGQGNLIFSHRRLLDPDRDIEYVVETIDDLTSEKYSDDWPEADVGEDVILLEPVLTGDGVTELERYRVVQEKMDPMGFFRLKVIQE